MRSQLIIELFFSYASSPYYALYLLRSISGRYYSRELHQSPLHPL